jgi:hypothetical protein
MKRILILSVVVLALLSGVVKAQDNSERSKIEYLIGSIETLNGAIFIRTSTEYDGKAAAKHLRKKLQNAGGNVKTADDFITLCASKSSISGKPYLIKSSDGNTIKAEQYFREKLREYNATAK